MFGHKQVQVHLKPTKNLVNLHGWFHWFPRWKSTRFKGYEMTCTLLQKTFKPFDFPIIRIDLKPSAVTIIIYIGTLYVLQVSHRKNRFCFKNCSELIWEKNWNRERLLRYLDQFIQVKGQNDFWEIIDFLDLMHLKNWLGCGKLQE